MNEWIARASTKGSGSGLSECTLPTPSSSQGRLYIWTEHSILTVTAYGGPKNLNNFTPTQSIIAKLLENTFLCIS
jgi:hypothetical protein